MRPKENTMRISGRTSAPAPEHYAGDPATLFTGSPNVPILRDRAAEANQSHEIHRPTHTHARRRTRNSGR